MAARGRPRNRSSKARAPTSCEFPLHHPYAGGPDSSQLSDALAYLDAHPGSVNPITIDIGANDALGLIKTTCKLEAACIAAGAPAVFAKIGANLGLILGELRAAAPHAQIIVLGLYNPFGETITGGDALTAALNEVEAKVAAGVGARFADPLPFFNPPGALEAPTICLLTNMCTPLVDIHPTDLGYRVLGGLVLQQYVRVPAGGWAPIRALLTPPRASACSGRSRAAAASSRIRSIAEAAGIMRVREPTFPGSAAITQRTGG